ncbi:MAG: hypothetical protein ACRCYP_04350 [Alphaproteobacteria bacterium]
MLGRLTPSPFLKLAFFALLIPQFAFSSGKLETLSLSWSALEDEDVQALAPHLSSTLQMLNLSGNKIGDAGVKELAPYLPSTLQMLNLSSNKIGDEGLQALLPDLPVTLQMLNLDNNSIGDEGVQELIAKFPVTLRHLGLGYNPITDEGFANLLVGIPTTDLESLTIPRPSNLSIRKQFDKLRNLKGTCVKIVFVSFKSLQWSKILIESDWGDVL